MTNRPVRRTVLCHKPVNEIVLRFRIAIIQILSHDGMYLYSTDYLVLAALTCN